MSDHDFVPGAKLPETYEEYTVYVDSGEADEKFRKFCRSLGGSIETSWKGTHDV
ncbi:hypothetical protein [Mycobacteroides immunogenum]|nr:hypothetical protein [Mycobacteroides immunogenum]